MEHLLVVVNWAARRYWRCAAAFLLPVSFFAHAAEVLPPLPAPTAAEQKACTKPGRTGPKVQVCLSPQVWAQAVAGGVQTGLDEKGRPTGRAFHILVVGPGYGTVSPKVAPEFRRSLQQIADNKVATVLRRQLGQAVSPSQGFERAFRKDPKVPVANEITVLNQESARQAKRAIQGAVVNFESATRQLFQEFAVDPTRFRVAISESACLPSEDCFIPEWALNDRGHLFDNYTKLMLWQQANGIPQGQLQAFAQQDADKPLSTGAMQSVRKVPASSVTLELEVKNFERLVNKVRRGGPRYANGINLNPTVPTLLELSKRDALAVVDLLQSPVMAIYQLRGDGQDALNSISDELARTRITECSRLRGRFIPEGKEGINVCSGYVVTKQEVADCMNGLRCFPKVGEELTLDALLIVDPTDIRFLVSGVALPRIKLAEDIGQLETWVNECTTAKRDKTNVELTMCLAEKQAPKTAATMKCARTASGLKGAEQTAKLRDCLTSSLLPEQRKQLDCYVGEKSTVDKILCVSKDKMSPEARAVTECVQEARADKRPKRQMELCLLNKEIPGAGQALACFKEKADWKTGLACSMKGQVGGDVGKALDCAEKSNYKAEGTAVCMVKIPGDLGKLAQCAAQSGGNPYGAAVCAAGDGLTVDQRIALQCAAQSGGAPPTFAACLVGQMTMKELGYCKGKKFGKDNCFNQNNEFRKIFAQVGLPIGPKSVVADVINVHLKYLEAQVEHFSDLNEDAKRKLTDAAKVITESYRAVWTAHETMGRAGKGACDSFAKVFGKKKRC